MHLLYSIALALALVVTLPYWLLGMLRHGKYRAGFAARLGQVPPSLRETVALERCIWVHAVSVGEVLAVSPVIEPSPPGEGSTRTTRSMVCRGPGTW